MKSFVSDFDFSFSLPVRLRKGDTETSSGATGDESKTVSGDTSGETSFDEPQSRGLLINIPILNTRQTSP